MKISLKIDNYKDLSCKSSRLITTTNSHNFIDNIEYDVSSIHDLLFGVVILRFYSFLNYCSYFATINNVEFQKEKGKLVVPYFQRSVVNNFMIGEDKVLGKLEITYSVDQSGSSLKPLLSVTEKRSDLVKNFISQLFNMTGYNYKGMMRLKRGAALLNKILKHQEDKFGRVEEVQKVCSVEYKTNNEEKSTIHSKNTLEYYLLSYKYNYTIEDTKKDEIKIDETKKDETKIEEVTTVYKNKHKLSILEGFLSLSHLYEENLNLEIHKQTGPKKEPTPTKDLMSNEGYILATPFLIEEFKNACYFAIASTGKSPQTDGIKIRREVEGEDDNRRTTLALLGIEETHLLMTNYDTLPRFIIFYDATRNRLVLSFKSTTQFDELIEDSNCEYTSFYEGYTHTGFKRLAIKFVEKHSLDLLKLLTKYNTKDLLIIGHSLGGSLAALVTIILKREGILNGYNLTTISISSPPVVSYGIAQTDGNNMFSVSFKNDYLNRMSSGSLEEYKYICRTLGDNKEALKTPKDICDKIDEVRSHLKTKPVFPRLYHTGRLYHFKDIKRRDIPIFVYKEVEREFYLDLLLQQDSPKHHNMVVILASMEMCSYYYSEIDTSCEIVVKDPPVFLDETLKKGFFNKKGVELLVKLLEES